jgi:DNA-binding CsgD family transcriptional regulator
MRTTRPTDPHAFEAQLTSALYLAGEALASEEATHPLAFAAPEGDDSVALLEDYGWLRGLVASIRQVIAEDPRRAELLRRLPQGLGNGEVLRVLFGNLFFEQRHERKEARDSNGKKWLTEKQVEVLRDYALGKSADQIAAQRDCSPANVHKLLKNIQRRLNAQTPQEAVAVAISMGCLPMDVLDFVRTIAHCEARDYEPLSGQISAHGLENVADAAVWQELGAFGLLLMLATNTVAVPLRYAAHVNPANGVLYCLKPDGDGGYRARQVVGPGRIRAPYGLAIAPPIAARQGFTPGSLYVVADLGAEQGLNIQEIVEFGADGREGRAFCGGRSISSRLGGAKDLLFDGTGALLVTGGTALLRFTEGGARVHPLVLQCCTSVCAAPKGELYVAHSSSRGASIGVYASSGQQRRVFGQQPMETQFPCLQPLPGGEIAALCCNPAKLDECVLHIYDVHGDFLRSWRVANANYGAFAFNARDNCLYVPCRKPGDIAVYALDGRLQRRITLDQGIAPYAVTFDTDGALWCVGSIAEA